MNCFFCEFPLVSNIFKNYKIHKVHFWSIRSISCVFIFEWAGQSSVWRSPSRISSPIQILRKWGTIKLFTKKMPNWIPLKSLLVMPIQYHCRIWHTVCHILYHNRKKQKNTKKTEVKVLLASSKQAILKAEYLKSQIYTVGPFLSCTYFQWNYFFLSCLIVIDLQQLLPKI